MSDNAETGYDQYRVEPTRRPVSWATEFLTRDHTTNHQRRRDRDHRSIVRHGPTPETKAGEEAHEAARQAASQAKQTR